MRCGKGHDHETLEEVRACYGVDRPNYYGSDESWRNLPPKDRQMETLKRLRDQTGRPARFTGEITRGQASDEIGELKAVLAKQREVPEAAASALASGRPPWNDAEPSGHSYQDVAARHNATVPQRATRPRASDWPDIPEGWYATAGHANAEIDFWQVQVPTEGNWVGNIFVKRIIGGHAPQRIRWEEQAVALEAIRTAGPIESGALFGQKMGRCGKCGRHLTRKASREMGYGPDCSEQLGLGATWGALDRKYGGA